jgi:hypothetical protein
MQNLINANQKSTTETLMNDIGQVVPFYKENPSFPPLGTQFHNQAPTIDITGAIANKSVLIDLPSGGGFLYNMSVSLLCTGAVATADLDSYPGLSCWRYLQFESGGKILVYKTKNSLYAQLRKMQAGDFKNFCFRYAQFLNPNTELLAADGNTSFLTYIPFIDSFLSGPEKLLLLDNFKDLKLRIMFDTPEAAGLTAPITALTCRLVGQTYMPKLTIFSEMKLKNWSKPFVMEMINCDEENTPLTSTTSTRIPVNSSFLAFKTHIFIRQNNNTSTVGLPTVAIQTITLNLNGTVFLDGTIKPSRINECAARYGNSTLAPNSSSDIVYDQKGDDIITIDWGVLCSRKNNSGTAFWSELRGTNITVTYATLPAFANYSLYMVHEYYQGAEFTPGTGGGGYLTVTSLS